jgi:hypothetical protein
MNDSTCFPKVFFASLYRFSETLSQEGKKRKLWSKDMGKTSVLAFFPFLHCLLWRSVHHKKT